MNDSLPPVSHQWRAIRFRFYRNCFRQRVDGMFLFSPPIEIEFAMLVGPTANLPAAL